MVTRSVFALLLLAGCSSREPPATMCKVEARVEHREIRELAVPEPVVLEEVEPEPPPPRHFCEPGERRQCGLISIMPGRPGPFMRCIPWADGSWHWDRTQCNTPLVMSFEDAPVTFTHAGADFHVGLDDRTEWVSARTPWLALDRDGSGCIESERELFAGFAALAELDDNHDGVIDSRDRMSASLVLWADGDQDKRCTPSELVSLRAAGITALELAYVTPASTPMGSHEGETALVHMRAGEKARLVDVYLAPVD